MTNNPTTTMKHVDSTLTTATEASSSSTTIATSFSQHDSTIMNPPEKRVLLELPYTISLPLLVAIDMIGVSLVVPLLHSQYFALAGVTRAVEREWLASIFSASQIIGGILIGTLVDSQWMMLKRWHILLISFIGSAIAYGMITIQEGGLPAIVVSRITVGLVKQTMTITTSILAHSTPPEERATHVGRLNASVTVAWIIGPSAGAYLFSHVGTYAPIYVSCALFLVNIVIVLLCLPHEKDDDDDYDDSKNEKRQNTTSEDATTGKDNNKSAIGRIISNLTMCFNSNNPCLTSVVSAMLIFHWVEKTTSYKTISTFYENRYGFEPHQRGYLQSYQSTLRFIVQSSLIKSILEYAGGEVHAACGASFVMAIVAFAEVHVTLEQYLLLLCPLMATAIAILGVSLKSVISKVAPKQSVGSVFAALDVLQNAAQVTVPFYRTLLFSVTQPPSSTGSNDSRSNGDPDPFRWLMSSGVHWLVATAALSYLLLKGSPCAASVVGKEGSDDGDDDCCAPCKVSEREAKGPSNEKIKTN